MRADLVGLCSVTRNFSVVPEVTRDVPNGSAIVYHGILLSSHVKQKKMLKFGTPFLSQAHEIPFDQTHVFKFISVISFIFTFPSLF